MPALQKRDRQAVKSRFDVGMKRDVDVTLFTQGSLGGLYIPGRECKTCVPVQQLLEELGTLTPRLKLEVVDFYSGQDDAKERGVHKIPATLVGANGNDGARFYGLPSGFEFAVLLDTIISASQRKSPLGLESRRNLKRLKDDVHIQVFVTPA